MSKNILYLANIRMPSERAHGVQIAKTCEAFAKAGAQVELIVPDRHTKIVEGPMAYYGITHTFPITKLSVIDTVSHGYAGFVLETLSFVRSALKYLRGKEGIAYGRDEIVLAGIALFTGRDIVWESHTGAWNICARYLTRRARNIVVITNGLRDFYTGKGISPAKIIVAHDGIDLNMFQNPESKKDARARLRLPQNAKIALYIGALGSWKGTDTLFEASKFLPDDIGIAVITNSPDNLVRMKYPRVLFLGERPYRDLASNQAAADVLMLPTSGTDAIGARFTSPLKLFSYMASERPIVASDLPSMHEVLPKNAAYWFIPDDAKSCAEAIERALNDPVAGEKRTIAKEAVSLYTWDERAKRILSAL